MNSLPIDAAPYLDRWLGQGWTAHPLKGDASVRAYYRIVAADGTTYVLAFYPKEMREQLRRFLAAYESLVSRGSVPEVLRHCELAVLQRDVGDRALFAVLETDREQGVRLYRAAIDVLVAFQETIDPGVNAPFTADFFFGELEMARRFYVEQLMGFDGAALTPLMTMLSNKLEQHPYVLCHRDYHGQNIHISNNTLYLLDYQDLRPGPDTYDVASLLRDRGVARVLGDHEEMALLDRYAAARGATGDVRDRYFETLLQRSIKILGTFSSQPILRGRMHYLDFIPPTLESIERCLMELPRYAALRDIVPFAFSLDAAQKRAGELNRAITAKESR